MGMMEEHTVVRQKEWSRSLTHLGLEAHLLKQLLVKTDEERTIDIVRLEQGNSIVEL
jgi:hypothetical protein